jgi:hypothetical protein
MRYYKATRPDGTDFRTGRIDYAAALASGEVIRHPAPERVRHDASTYLSVSIEPADCTGMEWPCRLFQVEPVGRAIKGTDFPNKRCVSALRVVEELPAWHALGPNGQEVARFIASSWTITPEQTRRLRPPAWVARAAAWDVAWAAAWDAERAAERAAAWDAAWAAAWDAERGVTWEAAWVARVAAWALVVRDRITPAQFDTLIRPWVAVMGRTWEVTA